jgi:Zn-dependent peptidase ImmA (M78 family)
LTALKSFQEHSDALSTVATAFATNKSRLSDQVFGGAATSMNKWLDPENNPSLKWLKSENSAIGKLYYSSFINIIKITLFECFYFKPKQNIYSRFRRESFMNYNYTLLEEQIKNIYHHIGISKPEQLDFIKIASKLNVWVHFSNEFESRAVIRNGLYSIVINRTLSPAEQWQDFSHELSHVLNHSGNQLNLPESFIELQEYKANNFMKHFCVPSFMLKELTFPLYEDPIKHVMDTFNVTRDLAERRMDHFRQQISQSIYDSRIRRKFAIKTKTFNLDDCSDETKRIMRKLENQLSKKEVLVNGN